MLERLQSIRPRLQELVRLDPDFEVAEAQSHRYELAPPLSETEVTSFETAHNIVLPADYRAFLLEVGSAGAGPGYGLNAPGNAQHLESETLPEGLLATPFPLRDWLDLTNNLDNLSPAQIFSNSWVAGSVFLCHYGCGIYDLLVVSGKERGHVWTDDRINQFGIFPVAPNREQFGQSQEDAQLFTIAESQTERTTFLGWYEWWLDWSLEEAKSLSEL